MTEKGIVKEWTERDASFHDRILNVLGLKEYRGLEEQVLQKTP